MRYFMERVGWFGFVLLAGFMMWQLRGCMGSRLPATTETYFVNDTVSVEYPRYIEKPTFIDKIKWKTKRPYVIMPAEPIEDIDNFWLAYSVSKNGDMFKVVCTKNDSVMVQSFKGVGDRFTWWAGKTYMESYIIEHRFSNPFHWTGVLVGGQCSYSDRAILKPYIETGVSVGRVSVLTGTTNQEVYLKGQVRLW